MNEIIQSLEANATNGKENFCYISETKLNAIKELSKKEQQENQSLKDGIEKANDLIDTILTFNLFGEECPLNFGFEKDSLQEKAQNIFYEDDGEYCENNCDDCHKKCWLKFFERIQILKGDKE